MFNPPDTGIGGSGCDGGAQSEKWAADDLRSLNGQIEFLLAEAARRAGRWKPGGSDPPAANR